MVGMKKDDMNGTNDHYSQEKRVFIPKSSNGQIKGGTTALAIPAKEKNTKHAGLAEGLGCI